MRESVVAIILIILLLILANPFQLFMNDILIMMFVLALAATFGIFASLIWREKARDEREQLHSYLAGRVAFLSGAAVLLIAIIIQSLSHSLDYWVALAFGVMIVAKAFGLIYAKTKY